MSEKTVKKGEIKMQLLLEKCTIFGTFKTMKIQKYFSDTAFI